MQSNSLSKPFIFGSTGCLGIALKEALLKEGAILDSHIEGKFKREFKERGTAVFDLNAFRNSGYTSVIYAAQSRRYKEFPAGISELTYINTVLPIQFSEICSELSIPFVFCSTGSVYRSSMDVLNEDSELISENSLTPYVASKLFTDLTLINKLDKQQLLIFRPFFIYGKGAKSPALFPTLVNMVRNNLEIKLIGVGGLELNPISSLDAARAICFLLKYGKTGVFNLAGLETVTIRKIATIISGELDIDVRFEESEGSEKILSNQEKLLDTGFNYHSRFEESFGSFVNNSTGK